MTETTDTTPEGLIPWHGVLAPEGEWSGDRRRFAVGSLTWRDLPLPFTWQKVQAPGHDGSVTVCDISKIVKGPDNVVRGSGYFLATPEADEAVGLVAHFGRYGVSVDADSGVLEMSEDDGEGDTFSEARICSASMVNIPAFAEAWMALGEPPEGFFEGEAPIAAQIAEVAEFVSEKPWDGSASRFTPEQWKSACVLHVCDGEEKSCHKLPVKEPGGSLSRAGVHAAAARVNQVDAPPEAVARAKAALRGAYKTLGDELPDVLKATAETEEFKDLAPGITEDGPGWLTHPVDTDRLRDYWVRGAGAAKIAWGAPGDFNRCRVNLAEYVKPQYLNGYCANRHFDALGFWPGEHHTGEADTFDVTTQNGPLDISTISTTATSEVVMAPAVSLVASSAPIVAPSAWFADPVFAPNDGRLVQYLDGTYGCPLTVTPEGRVFGHAARWGVCHTGFDNVCKEAPPSPSNYAYFRTGAVLTEAGDIPTGPLTLANGHAKHSLRARAAIAHYDNTCTAWADVAAGADEYGIWVAGWVRPGTPPETVVAARASVLSGDWREIAGALDMIAVLCVNTGGFPVPRVAAAVENGRQITLVAAGMLPVETHDDLDELASLVADRLLEREAARAEIDELADMVDPKKKKKKDAECSDVQPVEA